MRAEGEDMFGKSNGSNGSNGQLLDEQLGVAPPRETKVGGAVAQPQHSSVAQPRVTLQPPQTPEIHLHTVHLTAEACVDRIMESLVINPWNSEK